MLPDFTLLNIQKLIFLLDDFHFDEYCRYLESINAKLPHKLAVAVRNQLPGFDTHEALCVKVYGGYEKTHRQSFNQLASYTFKLSGYLAINHPFYLSHNYNRLLNFINERRIDKGNFLADTLLDIAERVEDYQTLIFTLKFLSQQAYLYKDITSGTKLSVRLNEVLVAEKLFSDILFDLRNNLNVAVSSGNQPPNLAEYKVHFHSLFNNPFASIAMLAKYACIYTTYYFTPQNLDTREIKDIINELERDLENYSYVIFPYMFDLKSNVKFLKLNSAMINLSSKEGKRELNELIVHSNHVKFWKNYLNIPQILALTIKATHYLSSYHYYVYRPDYLKILPEADQKELRSIIKVCEELVKHQEFEKHYKNDLINLRLIYGALQIMSGGNGIKSGGEELESMLIAYQQINLSGTVDSIFICLMVSYFAQKKYEKCSDTYKRYLKIIKGKPVYDDNDIGIHTYYYASQWITTQRGQYLNKLKANYERTLNNSLYDEPRKAMEEIFRYFNMPIELRAK